MYSFHLIYSGESFKNEIYKIDKIDIHFIYFIYSCGSFKNNTLPFIPPSLHPTISPFHLHIPPTLPPTSPPFCIFVLCKWRGGRARSCGEAARQGVKNCKRWDRLWHMQERKEKHTLYIAWKKIALANLMLCKGATALGSCLKKIIPTKFGNSFK